MYLGPRVHFNCIWLFANLSLLFSGLQNVLPRSHYFHLLPEGLKLLYIAKRFLHGCISPFVVKLHSNAYFWESPFAQLFLQTKNIVCMNILGKGLKYLHGKHSNIIYMKLRKHFTVVCSFWFAWVSPVGFMDVRVWLPGDLWAACYLWASLNPVYFGGGESKPAVSQLLAEFRRCRASWEEVSLVTQSTMQWKSRIHCSVLYTLQLALVSLGLHFSPVKLE